MPATSPYLTDYWTNEDNLQFSDFRPALKEIITAAQTPLTVGVFGPWGSGKTSLMRMLYEEIERGNVPNRRAVWFTAWKYDRHDALWRAFILRVLDGLYPREPGEGLRTDRPRLTNPTDPRQLDQIDQLQRLEESVYAPVTWEELGRWTVDWLTLAQQSKDAGIELAADFLPVPGILKRVLKLAVGHKDDDSSGVSAAIKREVQQYHLAQLEHMEQFEFRFQQAIKRILGDEGRLIVFVDDLDRCLPEKALEVLEAIKLFLEVEGAVFVLGMDQGVVKQGIETRYGALLRGDDRNSDPSGGRTRTELPISGDAYLQKIVQVPFHLPPLAVEDMEGFIAALDADAPTGRGLSAMTRAVLARGLLPNPRQVKRVLNIFRLLQTIAETRESRGALEPGSVAWPLLAKAVLIQTQFPGFYQEWRLRPTLIQELEKEYHRRPADEDEIIHGADHLRTAQSEDGTDAAKDAAAMRVTRPTPVSPGRGGLLDEYLADRRKYALLEQMLAYPPPDEDGTGRARARFAGLDRTQVAVYVRLAGTAGNGADAPADAPADLLAEMSSGDPAKMRSRWRASASASPTAGRRARPCAKPCCPSCKTGPNPRRCAAWQAKPSTCWTRTTPSARRGWTSLCPSNWRTARPSVWASTR